MALVAAAVVPQVLAWWWPSRNAGAVLVDLGRPDRDKRFASGVLFALLSAQRVYDIMASPRRPSHPALDWGMLVVFVSTTVMMLLFSLRRVSVCESGILAADRLIEWSEIRTWSVNQTTGTLIAIVKGAGLVRTVLTSRAVEDRAISWPLEPAQYQLVEGILGAHVPPESPLGLS